MQLNPQHKAALDKIAAAGNNQYQIQLAINEARSAGVDAAVLDKINKAKENPEELQQALKDAQASGSTKVDAMSTKNTGALAGSGQQQQPESTGTSKPQT